MRIIRQICIVTGPISRIRIIVVVWKTPYDITKSRITVLRNLLLRTLVSRVTTPWRTNFRRSFSFHSLEEHMWYFSPHIRHQSTFRPLLTLSTVLFIRIGTWGDSSPHCESWNLITGFFGLLASKTRYNRALTSHHGWCPGLRGNLAPSFHLNHFTSPISFQSISAWGHAHSNAVKV